MRRDGRREERFEELPDGPKGIRPTARPGVGTSHPKNIFRKIPCFFLKLNTHTNLFLDFGNVEADWKKRACAKKCVNADGGRPAARRGVSADDGRDAKVRQEEEGVARVLRHVIFSLSGEDERPASRGGFVFPERLPAGESRRARVRFLNVASPSRRSRREGERGVERDHGRRF